MIDPPANRLFKVSMHYKTDCLTKSGDGEWSAAPTVEDGAGPSSPSGPPRYSQHYPRAVTEPDSWYTLVPPSFPKLASEHAETYHAC